RREGRQGGRGLSQLFGRRRRNGTLTRQNPIAQARPQRPQRYHRRDHCGHEPTPLPPAPPRGVQDLPVFPLLHCDCRTSHAVTRRNSIDPLEDRRPEIYRRIYLARQLAHAPPQLPEGGELSCTLGAALQMGPDIMRDVPIGGLEIFLQVRVLGHRLFVHFSFSISSRRARCRGALQVPSARPVISAISWWVYPSISWRTNTLRLASGSAASAASRSICSPVGGWPPRDS